MLTLQLSDDPTISLFSYLSKRNKNICLDKAYIQVTHINLIPNSQKVGLIARSPGSYKEGAKWIPTAFRFKDNKS